MRLLEHLYVQMLELACRHVLSHAAAAASWRIQWISTGGCKRRGM